MQCRTCEYLSREVKTLLLSYLAAFHNSGSTRARDVLASFDARVEARKREIARHQMQFTARKGSQVIQ